MKNIFSFLISGFLLAHLSAQTTPAPADWQADLRFLQNTVHKDYPFLFKKITATAWDAEVEKLYAEIPTLQPHEILAGFGRIVSSFQYGHTDIGWRQSPLKYHVVPLNLYWFSDGIYIEGAHKDYAKTLGAKVLKVEGMAVEDALKAVRPLVSAENEQFFKAYGLDMLCVPEALHAQRVTKALKNAITLTLEQNGKTFEQTFAAVDAYRFPRQYGFVSLKDDWMSVRDQNATPYYLKNLDKIYYFEYLPEQKTVYVRHSQIQDDPSENIPDFYQRVFDFIEKNDVERLVLDVRLNGGGNNYKNKPIVTGIIRTEKINQPGKLFVLIGRRTFSACQNLVNELSNYTNAIFVGEPTAENINFYGDNRQVLLPNSKLPVYLSFAWWQDKPQWENDDWLAPHVAVDMTFDDYRSNRDPVLEAALAFSDKSPILDPMAHLRELFQAGKLEQVRSEAEQMVKNPQYRYVNFESKFNQAGYDLLRGGKTESAIFVFQLNTQLFPQSANVYDSYGEALAASGKTDEAIKSYRKAVETAKATSDPNLSAFEENLKSMEGKVKKEP